MKNSISTKPVKLPAGSSEFKKIIDGNFYYIDKTMLVKDIWDEGEVILITRPRRFGKTLNMTMLKCFFDIREKDENKKANVSNAKLSDKTHLRIAVVN